LSGSSIESVYGRAILDSRGVPAVEVEVALASGARGRGAAPSGAAPNRLEKIELRDRGAEWGGRGVSRCVDLLNDEVAKLLRGRDAADQRSIDGALVECDGSPRLGRLGTNSLLAASIAVARAAAADAGEPLWRRLGSGGPMPLPVPLMNVVHGGPTAPSPLDFQEFMIVPHGADSFFSAIRMGAEVYHRLRQLLEDRGLATGIGDEGGFCPGLRRSQEALDFLLEAIETAGYAPGREVGMAVDVGANALWDPATGVYDLPGEGLRLSREEMIGHLSALAGKYPLLSIEDGLDEEDWEGWAALTTELGAGLQIVADDVFVGDPNRLQRGVELGVANAVLIKPNHAGTLSATLDFAEAAAAMGLAQILSHRSGETEDPTIADLAVATGCGQIKAGAPARGERVSRYNHLIRIEERLGEDAAYAGGEAFASAT
jgi:enolase